MAERDENRPPLAENVSKDAIAGRTLYSSVMDGAFQEVYAQTGPQIRREAIAKAADAWNALDKIDPEGEFQLLKLIIEKVQR